MQAVQAAQITFEDYFLSSMDVPPLKIVGFEGLWGAGVMLLILLPIVQLLPGKDGGGLHEDSLDTLHVRLRGAAQKPLTRTVSCVPWTLLMPLTRTVFCARQILKTFESAHIPLLAHGLSADTTLGTLAQRCVSYLCLTIEPNGLLCLLLQMIMHSKAIFYILLIDMAALLMYNVSGMCVTGKPSRHYVIALSSAPHRSADDVVLSAAGQLGAVFRTVLETMRTLFVWLVRACQQLLAPGHVPPAAARRSVLTFRVSRALQVDLLLFYTPLGGGTLGESWSVYSYIQALGCDTTAPVQLLSSDPGYCPGLQTDHRVRSACLCRFVVLVCGTLVYGKGDEHEQKQEHEALIQEALVLGGEAPPSSSAPPPSAPVLTRSSAGGTRTAPMAMTTPSSFKVLFTAHVCNFVCCNY